MVTHKKATVTSANLSSSCVGNVTQKTRLKLTNVQLKQIEFYT